ncbi:MAG: assimilatory sulfite reductase (NADPH) flavoprotein subunit [Pseudomonadales bacterium]|nr:assimilatory sulfite reductase (NADPH) flavoprotein subunit [Pseudomonadales bacterium]
MKNTARIITQASPLNSDQAQQLDKLTRTLTPLQSMWVSGYLAGQQSFQAEEKTAPSLQLAASSPSTLTILFGSQTGNAEAVAQQVLAAARDHGIQATLLDMAAYKPRDLKKEQALLLVVSTQGEGDPPDSAQELHAFLHGNKAPQLDGLRYSVLALGDSSYEYFCKTGKDFDQRLSELGAERVHERVDCDLDYDDAAEQWIGAAIKLFEQSPETADGKQLQSGSTAAPAAVGPTRKNPYQARLLTNIVLNGRGSSKEVHHIELDTEDSGLVWEPGDSLGVVPSNPLAVVDELIETLALDPNETVSVTDTELSLREALTHHYEITTLTRPVVEKYAALAESKRLHELLSEAQRTAFSGYVQDRQLLDLIEDHPLKGLDGSRLIALLRKLPPRLYSIASSHQANPDEVHLTVAAVRYKSHGRQRQGVASIFLAEGGGDKGTVPVYVDRNKHFRLPADDVPIIMIGPGTGVAPFRAFMEEREVLGASGANWLFFGAQHFLSDFYYQTDWLRWRASGLLTRLDVAFSRDQAEKIYVQDRLREQARELYAWLQEGAQIYVCGDAQHMAPDVHAALTDIIADQGGLAPEAATAYLNQLQKDQRYHRDVY